MEKKSEDSIQRSTINNKIKDKDVSLMYGMKDYCTKEFKVVEIVTGKHVPLKRYGKCKLFPYFFLFAFNRVIRNIFKYIFTVIYTFVLVVEKAVCLAATNTYTSCNSFKVTVIQM